MALALFGVASLACAYATSAGELIAARAVLGLAAAVILPLSLAVLPVLFTPAEQPRAIALLGGATFLGYPVGPILGGWLLDHFWWGSVFLINVPVVVIAVVAVAVLMPESRSEQRPRLDVAGMLVSARGLAALTYGVIKAGQNGWADPAALPRSRPGPWRSALFVGLDCAGSGPRRQPLADLTLFGSAGSAGARCWPRWSRSPCSGCCSGSRSTSWTCAAWTRWAAGRLLPMIGRHRGSGWSPASGCSRPRRRAAAPRRRVSAKALVSVGFASWRPRWRSARQTTRDQRDGPPFAAWLAATGLGLGLALPTP